MSEEKELKYIPIDELHIDPMNVRPVNPKVKDDEENRTVFDLDSEEGLYPDIKSRGVDTPVIVRPHNGEYGVVAGARRYRAAKDIGIDELPCVVRKDLENDDDEAKRASFRENMSRCDLPGWRIREIVQEEYEKTDVGKSKNKRVKEVMDKLSISKGTVYNYVDFKKLDPTLNIRQKEPSMRTEEEVELLESSLSENRSTLTGGSEDIEEEEYERKKAKGFPDLVKIPVRIGRELHESEFFQKLQKKDLGKSHKLATDAVKAGQKRAPKIIRNWEKETKKSKKKKRKKGGRPLVKLAIEVNAVAADGLDRMVENEEYGAINDRETAAVTAIEIFLQDRNLLED